MSRNLLCTVAVLAVAFGLSGVSAHAQDFASDTDAQTLGPQTMSVVPAAPAAAPAPAPRPSFLSDNGKFSLFVGYSFLDTNVTEGNDGEDDCNDICSGRTEGSGFAVSGTYMLNENFGLTADFSGNYGGVTDRYDYPTESFRLPQNSYYILFGPTVSKRVGKVNLSAHALAGIARLWAAYDFTNGAGVTTEEDRLPWQTGFAVGLGGSADWMFSNKWGWRVAQIDWLWSDGQQIVDDAYFYGEHLPVSAVRLSTGLVFNFGRSR